MKNSIKIATLALSLLVLGGCVVPIAPKSDRNESNNFDPQQADPDSFWSDAQRQGRGNMRYNPCISENPDDLKNRDVGFTSSSNSTENSKEGRDVNNKAKTRNNSDCVVSQQ